MIHLPPCKMWTYYQSHQSGIETFSLQYNLVTVPSYQSHQSGIETFYEPLITPTAKIYQSHQSGIETMNQFPPCMMWTSTNRTNLELKRCLNFDFCTNAVLPIAPIWNWNQLNQYQANTQPNLPIAPIWNWNIISDWCFNDFFSLPIAPIWNWNLTNHWIPRRD